VQEALMRLASTFALLCAVASPAGAQAALEHKVLATNKTSTMEKELNSAAEAGYRFQQVMGGESAVGGKEVVVVMSRSAGAKGRYGYRLLASSKKSTMQKELQDVVILERDREGGTARFDYKLIATTKTSTLEKELKDAGAAGYEAVGMTVGKTALGGKELVAITRKPRP
jgi:hypothetical protein